MEPQYRSLLRTTLSLCILVLFFSGACRRHEGVPPTAVVKVGDRLLTLDDFKRSLERNTGMELAQIAPKAESPLLDQFVEEVVLSEWAAQSGFDVPSDKIAQAVRSEAGSTVVEKRDELRRARLIADITAKVAEPTKEQIRRYYDEHAEEFRSGEQVHVKQILVRDRKVADDIIDQLRHGASFEELSQKFSSAPNASRGGEIGYVGRGQLPKVFEDEIFRLRPGLTSNVIETDSTFHIFKVDDYQPAGTMSLDSAEPLIRSRLKSDAATRDVDALVDEAARKITVTVFTKRLPFDYTGHFPTNKDE
jgi:parvulin-like peptidyl-prolyl isomerase